MGFWVFSTISHHSVMVLFTSGEIEGQGCYGKWLRKFATEKEIMPFPLIKLGYLALKHISKPLANGIKMKAKSTPFLRNRILLPAAQRTPSCFSLYRDNEFVVSHSCYSNG